MSAPLSALTDFVEHLDGFSVSALCEGCNRNGWQAIRRANLDRFLPQEGRRRLLVDAEAAHADLDRAASQPGDILIHGWAERFLASTPSVAALTETVCSWLEASGSPRAVHLAASVIRTVGGRTDLERLIGTVRERGPRDGDCDILDDAAYEIRHRTLA